MKFNLKEKLAKLDENLPKRRTAMLPSEAFFCRTADIPEGTAPADVAGFVQLELESSSPFPPENLAWGYIVSEKRALIFAATNERAFAGIEEGTEKLDYALPSFLPFCLEPPASEDSVRLCRSGESASALFLKAGSSLPFKIISCKIEDAESGNGNTVPDPRNAILAKLRLPSGTKVGGEIRTLETTDSTGEEQVAFKIRIDGDGKSKTIETRIAGDALWNADTRGRTFATATRNARRKDFFVWMAFVSAGWTAAALILATLFIALFSMTTSVYGRIAKSHRTEVEKLQNKADFATNLESVTEREMKPFSMVAVASRKRPQELCYNKASSDEWNVLRLEGEAARSDLVQNYIEDLGKDPDVREVRTLRTSTSGGRSTFDIEVVFNPLEDISTGGQPSSK